MTPDTWSTVTVTLTGDGRVVAVSATGCVLTSPDKGVTWTTHYSGRPGSVVTYTPTRCAYCGRCVSPSLSCDGCGAAS